MLSGSGRLVPDATSPGRPTRVRSTAACQEGRRLASWPTRKATRITGRGLSTGLRARTDYAARAGRYRRGRVRPVQTGADRGARIVSELPETRFTRVDDPGIAYQGVGPAAELDVVFVPGWVSHLEVMWELPEFAHFLERLVAMGRLIMFDKRGTGLSDRVPGVPTLEERADDIAAVMDAAGSARAAIAAWGEGAGIAAMFAATHPERVVALVLGSLPVKTTGGTGPMGPDPAIMQALTAAVEHDWGQASLVPLLAPSRAE